MHKIILPLCFQIIFSAHLFAPLISELERISQHGVLARAAAPFEGRERHRSSPNVFPITQNQSSARSAVLTHKDLMRIAEEPPTAVAVGAMEKSEKWSLRELLSDSAKALKNILSIGVQRKPAFTYTMIQALSYKPQTDCSPNVLKGASSRTPFLQTTQSESHNPNYKATSVPDTSKLPKKDNSPPLLTEQVTPSTFCAKVLKARRQHKKVLTSRRLEKKTFNVRMFNAPLSQKSFMRHVAALSFGSFATKYEKRDHDSSFMGARKVRKKLRRSIHLDNHFLSSNVFRVDTIPCKLKTGEMFCYATFGGLPLLFSSQQNLLPHVLKKHTHEEKNQKSLWSTKRSISTCHNSVLDNDLSTPDYDNNPKRTPKEHATSIITVVEDKRSLSYEYNFWIKRIALSATVFALSAFLVALLKLSLF